LEKNFFYKINKEFVVYEQMDIELTVINLQKGHYFIGKNSAIDIFLMLESPMRVNSIVDKIMSIYSIKETIARKEIQLLIQQWLANDLITELNGCSENLLTESPAVVTELIPWAPPLFIAFDDMRDLLLLDPIHDTALDQQGWPISANDSNR
tara:strand:- start:443 stop:898 length:456 start_codon:yes stop_codon:yes gene_type:complete